ncbi:hypothetical protein [Acidiplasma cupricumulans]|uniref:hypothetical protein n=1 Tax=Acidiplasma cupricumulans TaxID=312540 RepID=UPI0007848BEA|nr:hypothetical protein [Acidiplasma cupricumulans]
MRLGIVSIDNKRHIALFNGNKIALADNFGVKKQAIKDLDREDFKKLRTLMNSNHMIIHLNQQLINPQILYA